MVDAVERDNCVLELSVAQSCFTGGVRPLRAGDQIRLASNFTVSLLDGPTNTFFGINKLMSGGGREC